LQNSFFVFLSLHKKILIYHTLYPKPLDFAIKKHYNSASEIKRDKNKMIELKVSIEQAQAISKALDVYSRLCIGQIGEIAEMVADGTIPVNAHLFDDKREANIDVCNQVRDLTDNIQITLGFSSGSSLGMSNKNVCKSGHRAWEVCKTLDRALAIHRDPNPSFKGVNYDGLIINYTGEPKPIVLLNGVEIGPSPR
jgi:hypothetical protein